MTPLADSIAIAEFLGVPLRTLDQWAYRRTGPPFVKVGRHRRYRWEAVHAWLDSQTVTADDRGVA